MKKSCLLHKWKLDHESGVNKYFECTKCKDRKVSWPTDADGRPVGYSAIDIDWIKRK